jgi:carboxypeptidase T
MKRRLSRPILIVLSLLLGIALLPGLAGAAPPLQPKPDDDFVVRVYYETVEEIARLSNFDVFEYNNMAEKYVLAAVDRSGMKEIEKLGFRVEVDAEETANFARLSVPLAQRSAGVGIESIPGYSCYRTVEETYAAAAALAAAHPNLATWSDVGDSWEKSAGQADGYDMMVLKLTNSAIPGSKPRLFITASIHAREYAPAELATRFAEYLVNSYGTDADVTWLLDYQEIHLMFHANPDGRKEAESGLSWRKNTDENYCGATSTSRGADLNRNFSFRWGCCGGSSATACNATYRGPSAGSEPETQAIQNYMLAIFPDQRGPNLTDPAPGDATGVYVDLHSYAQLVLWPWGFQSGAAPNGPALQTLGRKLAYFNSYTPQQSYVLYVTDGTTDDFLYGELGVAAYTIEVGTAFFQDCTTFNNSLYPTNQNALLYAAKVARTPYQTPAGPDALSLAVTPASVATGAPATLTATVNDTRYRNNNGTEPSQVIAAAEVYVDAPPWQPGATAIAMTASDGSFDGTVENVTATVDTTGLATGRHILFVRGRDQGGNWGAFSALFLTVTGPASQPPTADPQTVSTAEDTALGITLTGSDPENAPLSFSVTSGPSHGALSGTAPNLTYTPAANHNGGDSFAFVVNDGQTSSAPAAVGITVTPVNDAPVANPQSVTTQQNTALAITLTGSDVDGDALTFGVQSGPSHGGLSGTAPALTYTPNSGYTGPDSFTLVANDGQMDSAPAAISIAVNAAGPLLYLGSSSSGTAGGVSFADEDVLIKNVGTGAWSLFFDGSDVGLANTDVDAFERQADGSLLMSFDGDFTLTGVGAVDDSDILKFAPTSTGGTTAGTWSFYFDGSDVGLTTGDEDVDAFDVLPDGRLLFSTLGNVSVTGASGVDEDLLVFTATALGATTGGAWAMYFDGSDVGLSTTTNEDVNGVWVDAAGKIHLTTLGAFSVTGVSGDGSDVFVCTPGSLGATTTCTWAMYWDGSVQGFSGEDTDSLAIAP